MKRSWVEISIARIVENVLWSSNNALRKNYVDAVKGMGVLLMIVGHCIGYSIKSLDNLNNFINYFHMPLFFAASGMLKIQYRDVANRAFFQNLVKRIDSLIVPVLLGILINKVLEIFLLRYVEDSQLINLGGFWFLVTLFLVHEIWEILCKVQIQKVGITVFCIYIMVMLFFPNGYYSGTLFSLDLIPRTGVGLWFYYVGYLLEQYIPTYLNRINRHIVLWGGIILITILFLFCPFEYVRMYNNHYGNNKAIFTCYAVMMIMFLYIFCICLENNKMGLLVSKILGYIGKHSMGMMLCNFAVYKWIGLLFRMLNIDISCGIGVVLFVFTVSFMTLLVCLGIEKIFPILVGKKKICKRIQDVKKR